MTTGEEAKLAVAPLLRVVPEGLELLPLEVPLPPLLVLPPPSLFPMLPTGASASARQEGMVRDFRFLSLSKRPQ